MKSAIIFFIFLLFMFPTFALTQDEYCGLFTENITFSQCNELWLLLNNSSSIVTNQTIIENNTVVHNNTIIQNHTSSLIFDIDEHEDDLKDLIAEEIEVYEKELLEERDFQKFKAELEHELKLAELGAKDVEEIEECDFLCELEKEIKRQDKIDEVCLFKPNLPVCNSKPVENTSVVQSNPELDSKLETILSQLSSNKSPPVEDDNSFNIVLIIAGLCVAYFVFQYMQNKNVPSKLPTMAGSSAEDKELARLHREARDSKNDDLF